MLFVIGAESAVVWATVFDFRIELKWNCARLVAPLLIEIPLDVGRYKHLPLLTIVAASRTAFSKYNLAVGQVNFAVYDVLALRAHRSSEFVEHRTGGLHYSIGSRLLRFLSIYRHKHLSDSSATNTCEAVCTDHLMRVVYRKLMCIGCSGIRNRRRIVFMTNSSFSSKTPGSLKIGAGRFFVLHLNDSRRTAGVI